MLMFTRHLLSDHIQFNLIHGPNIQGSYAILFFTASDFTFTTRNNPKRGIVSTLAYALHSFCSYFSTFLVAYRTPTDLGVHHSVSHLFTFSYCSWDSQGKNTEVVCHSLLQWTMFCQALTSRDMPFSHSA